MWRDVCVDMRDLLGDPLHLEPAVCGVDGSHDVEMPALDWDKHSKSFNNNRLKSNRFIW